MKNPSITSRLTIPLLIVVFFSLWSSFITAAPQNASHLITGTREEFSELWYSTSLPFKVSFISSKAIDNTLTMPVKGVKVKDVRDTWGAPRPNGRTHKGQDIFAPRDTAIYSATEGYVIKKRQFPLGGRVVFIIGPGGRRYYYAHLDYFSPQLKEGRYVTENTIIGFVGNTGNAKNTPSHLHFSVYNSDSAIDPLPFLVNRNKE